MMGAFPVSLPWLKRRECEGKKTSWQLGSMEMDKSLDRYNFHRPLSKIP